MKLWLAPLPLLLAAPATVKDDAPSTSASAPPSFELQDQQLAQLLLTEDDLSDDWFVEFTGLNPSDGDDPATDPCFDTSPFDVIDFEHDPAAGVFFASHDDPGLLGQVVVEMGNEAVGQFVDETRDLASMCVDRLARDPEGGTMEPIDVPEVGDDAVGYRSSAPPSDGIIFDFGVVAIAVGDKLVLLFGIESGAEPELLTDLATIAVARATG